MTSPTDAPPPALGELARRATETIAARKAFDAVRFPTDFNSREGEVYEATRLAYRDALREWEAAVSDSANGPELVLQLVALATGGAEDTARLDWLESHTWRADNDAEETGPREMPMLYVGASRAAPPISMHTVRAAIDAARSLTPERPADAGHETNAGG